MECSTRSRVAGSTKRVLFTTCETVEIETLAAKATSLIVIRFMGERTHPRERFRNGLYKNSKNGNGCQERFCRSLLIAVPVICAVSSRPRAGIFRWQYPPDPVPS